MINLNVKRKKYAPLFGGMGFHNSEAGMYNLIDKEYFSQVVSKCNKEIAPGFMRTWGGFAEWTKEAMDDFYEYYSKMQKKTDTAIYLVPGRATSRETAEERRKWASDVADNIAYLYHEKGMKHIRYFCMSNELALDGWGALTHKLEVFKEYQEYLWREFQKRNLPIGLLATDAAHYKNWNTIEWAMQNISYMTEAYCGHLYLRWLFDCEDLGLYKWCYKIFEEFSEMSKSQEKKFILGEYGWGGFSESTIGATIDVPRYVNTEKEAYSFLSIAEVTLAAMNAGVYTMSFWSFMDYPDPQSNNYKLGSEFGQKWYKNAPYLGWGTDMRYNKCGLLHWNKPESPAYDGYWCLGLMCRYLKQDSRVMGTQCDDEKIRSGAIINNDGSVSVCVVNRHNKPVDLNFSLNFASDKDFRVYRYDSDNVPRNDFADLQNYDCMAKIKDNSAVVTVNPNSVTIITTDYIDRTPEKINCVTLDGNKLSWEPSDDPYHCYYRVFSNDKQIASTIENELTGKDLSDKDNIEVCSVDIFGNCEKR